MKYKINGIVYELVDGRKLLGKRPRTSPFAEGGIDWQFCRLEVDKDGNVWHPYAGILYGQLAEQEIVMEAGIGS